MEDESTAVRAGAFRRIAALTYDLLLVVAIAFVVTFAFLPLSGGEAILVSTRGALARLYHVLLLGSVFLYFAVGWVRGGQTLGMKAWRIRVVAASGASVGWPGAATRFALGLGLLLPALGSLWQLSQPGWTLADFAALLWLAVSAASLGLPAFGRRDNLLDLAARQRVVRVSR